MNAFYLYERVLEEDEWDRCSPSPQEFEDYAINVLGHTIDIILARKLAKISSSDKLSDTYADEIRELKKIKINPEMMGE